MVLTPLEALESHFRPPLMSKVLRWGTTSGAPVVLQAFSRLEHHLKGFYKVFQSYFEDRRRYLEILSKGA